MAKRHDEWPGEGYEGSSLRGAIRGWQAMGVCSNESWKYVANGATGDVTVKRARDARSNTLGAYYRLRPHLPDYHAALNEVEAIYVSAQIHSGWSEAAARDGKINRKGRSRGGHAFVIWCNRSLKPWTGDSGFIVQIESRPHRGAGNMFCHALSSLAWRFSTRILAPI